MFNFSFSISGLIKKTVFIWLGIFCVFQIVQAQNLDLNITENTDEADLYWQIDGRQNPQNLYIDIYKSVSQDMDKEAMLRVTGQSGLSEETLREALKGNFTNEFNLYCQKLLNLKTQENLYKCLSLFEENYEYEKQLVKFEKTLQREAEATEIWSDGDLSNSFFDIMIDLQIIEIILFGENTYQYPFSEVARNNNVGFLNVGDKDANSQGGASANNNGNDSNGNNSDGNNGDTGTNTNQNGDNNNTDGSGTGVNINNGDTPLVCQDPDAILLGQNIWKGDTQKQNSDTSSTGTNSFSTLTLNNSSQNDYSQYRGGKFIPPDSNDDCSDPASRYFSEGSVSLYHGLLCTDPWPCNNVICITVSEVLQDVGSNGGVGSLGGISSMNNANSIGNLNSTDPIASTNSTGNFGSANSHSTKEDSVQGIVTAGIKQLNWLKGHNLTIKENSNERFFPSVSKVFKKVPALDTIVQNLPVKFVAEEKGTAFDDDNNLTKEILDVVPDLLYNDNELAQGTVQGTASLEKKIFKNSRVDDLLDNLCEETMLECKPNGNIVFKEAERTIQKQSEVGNLQIEVWDNVVLNREELMQKFHQVQDLWKEGKKFKYQQNYWQEIKHYFNMTTGYFQTIEGIFVNMYSEGKGILKTTGQPCK